VLALGWRDADLLASPSRLTLRNSVEGVSRLAPPPPPSMTRSMSALVRGVRANVRADKLTLATLSFTTSAVATAPFSLRSTLRSESLTTSSVPIVAAVGCSSERQSAAYRKGAVRSVCDRQKLPAPSDFAISAVAKKSYAPAVTCAKRRRCAGLLRTSRSLSGAPRTRTWNRRFWRPVRKSLSAGCLRGARQLTRHRRARTPLAVVAPSPRSCACSRWSRPGRRRSGRSQGPPDHRPRAPTTCLRAYPRHAPSAAARLALARRSSARA